MIVVRSIKESEIMESTQIYIDCWRNDYKHFVPMNKIESLDAQIEAKECKEWLYEDCDDIRLMYGAFIDGFMVGYVAASKNVEEPLEYDAEINGLFVRKNFRGLGISFKLLYAIIEKLRFHEFSKLLIYNFCESYSNHYYKKLNGKVLRETCQQCGAKTLKVEIFGWKLDSLATILANKLKKYPI